MIPDFRKTKRKAKDWESLNAGIYKHPERGLNFDLQKMKACDMSYNRIAIIRSATDFDSGVDSASPYLRARREDGFFNTLSNLF